MIQLPRVGWKLLACLNGASPDWIIVEWLIVLQEYLFFERLTLANFVFVDFRRENVFCFTATRNCPFSWERRRLPKMGVDFLWEKDTFCKFTSVCLHLFPASTFDSDLSLSCCRRSLVVSWSSYRATNGLRPQRHWCAVGVLAGTHQCATESTVTLWQSANPFICWLES